MRWSIGLCSSPRQYAPATLVSLNAPISPGRIGVAAAAEVGELADGVERDRLVGRDLAGDLDLVGVAVERRDRFVARDLAAGHRVVGGHDLAHAGLEPLEVLRA